MIRGYFYSITKTTPEGRLAGEMSGIFYAKPGQSAAQVYEDVLRMAKSICASEGVGARPHFTAFNHVAEPEL